MARIYIGVGSNIEREHYLRAGWQALQQVFSACCCSTVYESDAIGFGGAPFYNLVIADETMHGGGQGVAYQPPPPGAGEGRARVAPGDTATTRFQPPPPVAGRAGPPKRTRR